MDVHVKSFQIMFHVEANIYTRTAVIFTIYFTHEEERDVMADAWVTCGIKKKEKS